MSEPTPEPTPDPSEQGNPADDDAVNLGDAGKQALDRMKAERNEAKQNAAALQKQLDDINAANLSELERAQKEAKDAQDAAALATTEALRLRVAAKHGISDEDADLFLTGSDQESIEKQAAALVARTATGTTPGPRPDLSQGGSGTPAAGSPEQDFANFMGQQLAGR